MGWGPGILDPEKKLIPDLDLRVWIPDLQDSDRKRVITKIRILASCLAR
jgi:hypothetical protein